MYKWAVKSLLTVSKAQGFHYVEKLTELPIFKRLILTSFSTNEKGRWPTIQNLTLVG